MAEQFFFFNSVAGDEREYDQNQFSLALKHIAESNGISTLDYDDPLTAMRQPNGDIAINAGVMLIEGYVYVNDAALMLSGASYLQGEPRTDRVIVRLDRSIDVRAIHAQILQGTDGSTAPPALTRVDNAYDMSLALIKWNGTTASVEDTRTDSAVCGFIRDQYATHEELQAYETAMTELMNALRTTVETEMQQTKVDLSADLNEHTGDKSNPHDVTAQQVKARPDTWMPTPSDVGAATTTTYTATIPANWTGSTAPYTRVVTVTGILATDTPIVDLVPSSTYATAQNELKAWANVYRIVATANTLTFYSSKNITIPLNTQIQAVR